MGLKTRKLIFKRGTKGTAMAYSTFLMWVQVIATFILGIGLFIYTLVYTYIVLSKNLFLW
jgi:hypothetical protein